MAIGKQNEIKGFFSSNHKRKIMCRKLKYRCVSALQFKTNAPVSCKGKNGAKRKKKKKERSLQIFALLHCNQ